MTLALLPQIILDGYEVHDWRHSCAVLKEDFPDEWEDIIDVLSGFRLYRSEILEPGKNKSPISSKIDDFLYSRGWEERKFDTQVAIDGNVYDTPTHKVDCFRNGIALEIEWNNKDPFYDRDLNNFRLLHDLSVISVGVIITRSSSLQAIFNELGKGKSYGNSTTHMNKLLPRVYGGGAGGCPILIFGISDALYIED